MDQENRSRVADDTAKMKENPERQVHTDTSNQINIESQQITEAQCNQNGGCIGSDEEAEGTPLAFCLDTKLLVIDLPVEIIVQILDYLRLGDKYNASISCHLMYEAFNHPLLWRKQELFILSAHSNFVSKYHIKTPYMPEKIKCLIAKFGKYFQYLTINVVGFLSNLKDWMPALLELGAQCRLQKLVLQVGKLTTAIDQLGRPPPKQDLVALLSFIENASRMKTLDIKSWPLFPQTMLFEEQNIFKAMTKNPKFKFLERFDLFWPHTKNMWSERMPVLPDNSVVLNLVEHLSGLKELGLRSMMISNSLIEELANPQRSNKLNFLKIFVTYARENSDFEIPDICPSSWKQLVDANPDIQVECHVMSRIPNLELANMLTLDCPLSKIVFLQWARLDSQLIESLTNKYNKTLRTFVCHCDIEDIDEAIVKMVEECKLLDSLLIKSNNWHGIQYTTILKLASLRCGRWNSFSFNEKNISFSGLEKYVDEDTVISQNEKGEYVMVAFQNFNAEPQGEERKERLLDFKEELDTILGLEFISRAQAIIPSRLE